VPPTRYLFNNTCLDVLKIGEQMLLGEIEYRKENYEAAYDHLRQAVYLDDNLKYDEPWGWMQPARHALGALRLEQGQVDQAEAVYRDDLGLSDTLVSTSQAPRQPVEPARTSRMPGTQGPARRGQTHARTPEPGESTCRCTDSRVLRLPPATPLLRELNCD